MYNKYQIFNLILLYFVVKIAIVAAIESRTGNWEDLDVNSTDAKDAALKGLQRYSSKYYKGEHKLTLVEINEAKYRIVEGMKYQIVATLGETKCPKESKSRQCKLLKDAKLLHCYFELLDKPWMHKIIYYEIQCTTAPEK